MKEFFFLFFILFACSRAADQNILSEEKLNALAEKFFNKALAFEKKIQLDSAEIYYYKANDVHPNHPLILEKTALLTSRKNSLGTALIAINKSIRYTKDEQRKKIRLNLRGTIYLYMGEYDRAIRDWKRAKEFGEENLKEHGHLSKNFPENPLPVYYTLDFNSLTSLYKWQFPQNSFNDKEGGLKKEKHIVFTFRPKKGSLYSLVENSNLFVVNDDSSYSLQTINDTTFDLFIPKSYTEKIISFDTYIAPKKGCYLLTYFSNRIVGYPEKLHLSLQNWIVFQGD